VKIRQRLALRFTIVSALLTGAILILIYAVTQRFVHADFAERLVQQSRFEALHYESPGVKDVIPEGSFQLVNPSVAIYNEKGELLYTKGDYNVEPGWVKYLQSHTIFNAERGDYTTVGRRYFFNNMHGQRSPRATRARPFDQSHRHRMGIKSPFFISRGIILLG
jgi:hypothetical protein